MTIELVPLVTMEVRLGEMRFIGEGALGNRIVTEVQSVRSTGGRLNVIHKGMAMADWLLLGPGGLMNFDVRLTLETDDGALIYSAYKGRSVGLGQPIYVAPLFETSDVRYTWLNSVQAIGKGVLEGNTLTYEWYEVR